MKNFSKGGSNRLEAGMRIGVAPEDVERTLPGKGDVAIDGSAEVPEEWRLSWGEDHVR